MSLKDTLILNKVCLLLYLNGMFDKIKVSKVVIPEYSSEELRIYYEILKIKTKE